MLSRPAKSGTTRNLPAGSGTLPSRPIPAGMSLASFRSRHGRSKDGRSRFSPFSRQGPVRHAPTVTARPGRRGLNNARMLAILAVGLPVVRPEAARRPMGGWREIGTVRRGDRDGTRQGPSDRLADTASPPDTLSPADPASPGRRASARVRMTVRHAITGEGGMTGRQRDSGLPLTTCRHPATVPTAEAPGATTRVAGRDRRMRTPGRGTSVSAKGTARAADPARAAGATIATTMGTTADTIRPRVTCRPAQARRNGPDAIRAGTDSIPAVAPELPGPEATSTARTTVARTAITAQWTITGQFMATDGGKRGRRSGEPPGISGPGWMRDARRCRVAARPASRRRPRGRGTGQIRADGGNPAEAARPRRARPQARPVAPGDLAPRLAIGGTSCPGTELARPTEATTRSPDGIQTSSRVIAPAGMAGMAEYTLAASALIHVLGTRPSANAGR